jgi:hypothetical protein
MFGRIKPETLSLHTSHSSWLGEIKEATLTTAAQLH